MHFWRNKWNFLRKNGKFRETNGTFWEKMELFEKKWKVSRNKWNFLRKNEFFEKQMEFFEKHMETFGNKWKLLRNFEKFRFFWASFHSLEYSPFPLPFGHFEKNGTFWEKNGNFWEKKGTFWEKSGAKKNLVEPFVKNPTGLDPLFARQSKQKKGRNFIHPSIHPAPWGPPFYRCKTEKCHFGICKIGCPTKNRLTVKLWAPGYSKTICFELPLCKMITL